MFIIIKHVYNVFKYKPKLIKSLMTTGLAFGVLIKLSTSVVAQWLVSDYGVKVRASTGATVVVSILDLSSCTGTCKLKSEVKK